MKQTLLVIIVILLFSCSVKKKILISENGITKDLSMYIDPTIKKGGIGLYLISPFGIQIQIPELIKRLKVFDENNALLWEIEYKNPESGGHGILYGKLNKKEYIQIFPKSEIPKSLMKNQIYSIILTTEKAEYKKQFIFQESEIKITNNDIIVF